MKASWVNQEHIDRKKWDELVNSTPDATIYLLSFYLDATAIDWEAYIADDYSFAIPVGVVKKGGIRRAYPPLFQRYIQAIGKTENINWKAFESSLLNQFSKGDINLKSSTLPSLQPKSFVYQELKEEEYKLKTQAKRMLNRFEKTELIIREDHIETKELAELIVRELAKKLPLYGTKDADRLLKVVEEADRLGYVYKVGVFSGEVLKGGLIGLEYNHRLIYLKGTAEEDLQDDGAMYGLMHHFIQYGFKKGYTIDFGGSRVKGIQFFNTRFNGKDVEYFNYSWDNSPLWFKMIFGIYNKMRKR